MEATTKQTSFDERRQEIVREVMKLDTLSALLEDKDDAELVGLSRILSDISEGIKKALNPDLYRQ